MDYESCKTQKQLKACVRQKIDEIGLCSSIKQFYPNEWDGFMYLFKRHSDYPEKFHGLTDIKIRYNPVYKTQLETIIIKNNGDEDNVSVLDNCITGKPKDLLYEAMRNSIYPQIQEFKNNSVKNCVLCFDTKNIHIDHFEPQFIDLKTEFVNNWKQALPCNFQSNESHSKIFDIIDECFEKKWIEYHRINATLRVLCQKCNCSREKSKRFKCCKT